MRKMLRAGALIAAVAVFSLSLFGGQANAIVGGNDALQQYGTVSIWAPAPDARKCVGSLINKYWALTTAHCKPILVPGQTQIHASSKNNTTEYEEVGLAEVLLYPGADPNTNVNDLALIRFQHPVQNSQPLQMTSSSPAIGSVGTVAGWGWICQDLANPNCNKNVNILQELSIKVINDSECGWSHDPQNQLCGVAANGMNAMACRGDSGAPLVRKNFDGSWKLVGITVGDGDYDISHPNSCSTNVNGEQGAGLWVDVAKYRNWIIDTMYGLNRKE